MDYAISKYYESMGIDIENDYFNQNGIGKFEIYCHRHSPHKLSYQHIRETQIDQLTKKIALNSSLSLFDFENFPFHPKISNNTKRKQAIHNVLTNCWNNKYFYDKNHQFNINYYNTECDTIESCKSTVNICTALQFHSTH